VGFQEDHKVSNPSNSSFSVAALRGINASENLRNIIFLVILHILFLTEILFIPASANAWLCTLHELSAGESRSSPPGKLLL